MGAEGEQRRLAAILVADVVGYSSQIGADEAGALARLRAVRDVTDALIAEHQGRVFKTTGDGFLAEFSSAVQALRCAIALQTRLRSDDLKLRMGLHQGDVVARDGDLLGDGVNIAARLEPLAEAGGICISARVHEDAIGKITLNVSDMGEQALKNINRPIRVYRVRLDSPERAPLALPDKPSIAVLPFLSNGREDTRMRYRFGDHVLDVARRELRRGGEPVALEPQVFDLLVYLIRDRDRVVTRDDLLDSVWGGRIVSESTLTSRINAARKAVGDSGGEQRLIRTVPRKGFRFVGDVTDAPPETLPGPLLPQDRPSIAVLPFNNLSGDRGQEYFADGMAEEIITGLSRIKWLFVISRNSTFIYKGRPVDAKTVGQELGVRYMLEGSVRRSGNRVRVTGRLIETETGTHVWTNRYDGTLDDIFTLQDEMTMSVISAVEPTLRKAEVERARRKRPGSLDAYDLYLRAMPFAATAMPEDADKALDLLEQAIRLEPDYAIVHGFMAWCHEQRYLRGGLHAETRTAARHHAHAAIKAGGDDAMALAMGGFVIGVMERDYETALEALDRSLALSPSSALAFGFSSIVRAWLGDDTTAIEHGMNGVRLGPYDPLVYLPYLGLAYSHFFAGNFVEAASAARRASAANPQFSVPCYLHIAALVGLGRLDEANSKTNILLELQPDFTGLM